jgi:diguanylate cyclase (GGDEF)-like protein
MDPAERLEISSGLFPQKMIEMLLLHEVVRSRRYPSPVSVLCIAIRYPKDASAQIVESARLAMADLLQSKLRETDLPGLYEGNYLVIMPATSGPGAREAAERLLAAFRGSQVTRTAEPFEISISVGISSHPGGEGISLSGLLSGASSALWEAQKRGTKNLVVGEAQPTRAD